MIGTLNPNDKRVTVIGAGVSGLLIAYALKKKGYQVTIHEKTNRCGGLIETKETTHGMVETAAHSILVNETVQSFLNELGVEMVPLNPFSRARYIYRRGKMRRMPLSIFEIISTLFHFFSKPKLHKALNELTLEEWGNAYLGKAATQFLLAPFTAGIFACRPSELNAAFSFPKLLPASESFSLFRHFHFQKKSAQMMTFKNGTGDLIRKLEKNLREHIQFNSVISDLNAIEGNLVLSVPANDIQYSPLITATVFISKDAFRKHPPKGVGVLIPRGENLRMLGCLFNSSAFPGRVVNENEVSLTVMYGGTSDSGALSLPKDELKTLLQSELAILLNTSQTPSHIEITYWQRAVPIYSKELSLYIENLSRSFCANPGKMIFTNFSGQVSIRGMIESVQKL